jgi:hypothetical protein
MISVQNHYSLFFHPAAPQTWAFRGSWRPGQTQADFSEAATTSLPLPGGRWLHCMDRLFSLIAHYELEFNMCCAVSAVIVPPLPLDQLAQLA